MNDQTKKKGKKRIKEKKKTDKYIDGYKAKKRIFPSSGEQILTDIPIGSESIERAQKQDFTFSKSKLLLEKEGERERKITDGE